MSLTVGPNRQNLLLLLNYDEEREENENRRNVPLQSCFSLPIERRRRGDHNEVLKKANEHLEKERIQSVPKGFPQSIWRPMLLMDELVI